ncbi:STAS domain-containing protein [Qaidamihabitans albus]|uniref:STAS domain-containing protein n=1 Tax=Qaidamihabitans albus TaxID=2795733 RepID=UPI0018F15457|nr:STAS domain-containing protein [Qaidamihabitans albus]
MSELPPPSPLLDVSQERRANALIIRIKGEIDLSTAPELERHIDEALDELTTPDPLVLDLSDVAFIGSSGLALLLNSKEGADARGLRLCIVAAQRAIKRPVEAVGLRQELPLYPTLDAALNPS